MEEEFKAKIRREAEEYAIANDDKVYKALTDKEFNLSKKGRELSPREKFSLDLSIDNNDYIYYHQEDVKEFIRQLRFKFCVCSDYNPKCKQCMQIDKLAGDKLI